MRWFLLTALIVTGCGEAVTPSNAVGDAPKSDAVKSDGVKKPVVAEAIVTAEATPALEAASADGQNRLTPDEIQAGWLRLFDGHTLFGWKASSEVNWNVKGGVISADNGPRGLLATTTRFANYELRADFRCGADCNSGLFLRTPFEPKSPATDCYELNICDKHPEGFNTGAYVSRRKGADVKAGDSEWHTFHVVVNGPQSVVKLDGKAVLSFTDDSANPLKTGFIGLQFNEGKIEFRNLFLKPLGTDSLFNGTDLTGWRMVPGSKSEFKVADGAIQVTNGPGFLETEKTAGNFVFQFEAKTDGDALNSGVFFRAIAGTEKAPSHGYEFQIQHGIKNGDRNQPADFGTGAIFRRIAARRVVGNDREWCTGTLIADGPHLSTWVNGIQMVDWTDTRKPSDNPREGLRVKPGHISLQGHDPTTKLAFRNIRLATLDGE